MIPGAAVSGKSATTTARPERKPIPSEPKASPQAFARIIPSRTLQLEVLRVTNCCSASAIRRSHYYAVKSGALVVYEPRWKGHRAIIEFAFPGDLVGLGFLQTHTCSARATIETCVQCMPLSAQDHLFADDPRAQARLADAIEREVEFLREFSVRFSQQNPLGRLAAFLLTLSRENEQEGRDPTVLVQPLHCGVVADFLVLSVERLGSLLVELEREDDCAVVPQGLRLTDIDALEEPCRANAQPPT